MRSGLEFLEELGNSVDWELGSGRYLRSDGGRILVLFWVAGRYAKCY